MNTLSLHTILKDSECFLTQAFRVFLFLTITLTVTPISSDMIVLDDGMEYDPVSVISFQSHPDGNIFLVRTKEFGQEVMDHPIEQERIRAIRFREPDSIDGASSPRLANIRKHDGTILQSVPIKSLFYRNGTPVFSIGQGGEEIVGNTILSLNTVSEMLFAVPETIPPMYVQNSSLNLSSPESIENPLDQVVTQRPLSQELLGGGDYAGQEFLQDMDFGESSSSDVDFSYKEDSSSRFGFGNRSRSGWQVTFLGIGVSILSYILYVVVTSVIGGIYLYFASKIDGVSDFPLWKSFIAAGALAIFPVLFFLLCVQFIPIMGLWAGLAALYFTARAILMGAMEVMEEKAGQVLWTFIMLQIGVLVGAAYLI